MADDLYDFNVNQEDSDDDVFNIDKYLDDKPAPGEKKAPPAYQMYPGSKIAVSKAYGSHWKTKIEARPAYQRMRAKALPGGMVGSPPALPQHAPSGPRGFGRRGGSKPAGGRDARRAHERQSAVMADASFALVPPRQSGEEAWRRTP